MIHHRGLRIQHGTGIGSIFGSLFRALTPLAKGVAKGALTTAKTAAKSNLGKRVKKDLTKAAVNMALDTLKGEDIKSSAKTHLKQASKDILESANKSNNNKNRKRKRIVHHKTVKSKRKRERLYDEDI